MRVSVLAAILSAMAATNAAAGAVASSLRPSERPNLPQTEVRLASFAEVSPLRPAMRPSSFKPEVLQISSSNQRFENWVSAFQRRAVAQGIDPDVLSAAFRGVSYDSDVIRRDRNQSEFTKTIWDYLDSAVSDTRVANGKAALSKHQATLEAIEARYGVEKEVVAAIWGLESAYGSFRGSNDVIRSLATLAFDGRRGPFFEGQLVAALQILQSGDTSPRNMTGSWAGAMGHTQFIPSSYLDYAVDFTGDGRRDIWSDDPTDALASTAAYLARFGWVKGQPWGVEVQIPQGFDYRLANREVSKSPTDWAALGVRTHTGQAVPNHGSASILLPAGSQGAAFMIFKNFSVIERYNTADAYVIGVGHLSDRIGGAAPLTSEWPRGDRALTLKERKEMQTLLTSKGFSTQGIDGRIGPKTINAVRGFQTANGLVPDGYASLSLLQKLR